MRRCWAVAILWFAAAGQAWPQEQCAVAKDLVVRALELVSAQPRTDDLESGLQLLKHAAQVCNEYGDAWYYRSRFEQQLNHTAQASFALEKAKSLGSDALKQAADPFQLSTPLSRDAIGFGGTRSMGTSKPGNFGPEVADKWALVVGISNFASSEKSVGHRYAPMGVGSSARAAREPDVG